MSQLTCRFEPFDTWFFRESRPQGSIGASELGSVFPPPVRTLLGAVRTAIGDAWHARHGTDWRQFEQLHELRALIGYADDLGRLRCQGPFLVLNGQRLYPAPATLMVKDGRYFLLDLGCPVRCDLGHVHLPAFPAKLHGLADLTGARPAQHCWLTLDGWNALLAGQEPQASQVVDKRQLFSEEPRLGIGRDNQRSAVAHGMLYQTLHLRLHEGVTLELVIDGLTDDLPLPERQVIRLGGEGRQAALTLQQNEHHWPQAAASTHGKTLVLYTLSPTPCAAGLPAGIPAGFQAVKAADVDVWEGEISGVGLRILAVACGRPLREGGWDMARHQSRPVHSLLPAGSALFVQPLDARPDALANLHGRPSGTDAALGRGQLLLGRLPLTTTFPE